MMATASPPVRSNSARKKNLARSEALTGYLFIAPYLIIAGVFTFGLLFYAFYTSLTDLRSPVSRRPLEFVGFQNYIEAFQNSDFLTSLGNIFWFAVLVTIIQTIGAILLAVLLNAKLRGMRLYRTLLYSPSVASSIVISLIFLWLYQPTGFINYALGTNVNFLQTATRIFSPFWSAIGVNAPSFLQGPSVAWCAIMFLNIFTTVPTFMVLFLTSLQDIPGYVYEAGKIDGATGIKSFWYLTLPMLRPVITLVVVLGTIGTFQVFDQVAILTGGDPVKTTLAPAFLIYQKTLGGSNYPADAGLAAAMAFILAAIIVTFTLLQRRFIDTEKY
ncbi:MAG: sugar ABC transporter permease [Roseiflexaceae bacterium]|nr:sugar ABC transporter permease [Roseiflexaceae bacterium]